MDKMYTELLIVLCMFFIGIVILPLLIGVAVSNAVGATGLPYYLIPFGIMIAVWGCIVIYHDIKRI